MISTTIIHNDITTGDNSEGQFGNGKKVKSNYGLNRVGTAQTFNYEKICQVFCVFFVPYLSVNQCEYFKRC